MEDEQKMEPTVISSNQSKSGFHSALAMILWLGAIHFNVVLVLLALLFLPTAWAFLVLGSLVILMLIPVDENSKWGLRLARFICYHGAGYFPVTFVAEDMKVFDPTRSYVVAVEPHSVLPIGIVALCHHTGYMPLPKIKALASSAIFYTPLLRHIWSWMGLVPASRKTFVTYLNAGYSCIVIPGGVREIFYMEKGTEVSFYPLSLIRFTYDSVSLLLGIVFIWSICQKQHIKTKVLEVAFLKKRHGFVRVAIETGSPLVPVFCFGQTETYRWWKPRGTLYNQLARALRFTPLVFWGILGTPIPYRHPMYIVVGKPIEVEKNSQPSAEQVAETHTKFVSALQDLFERHKVGAGYKDTHLQVL